MAKNGKIKITTKVVKTRNQPYTERKFKPNIEPNKALDDLTRMSEDLGLYKSFCDICKKSWDDCECYDD